MKIYQYDESTWQQVNNDGFDNAQNLMGDTAGMAVFENKLYVGVKNEETGGQIWAYNGTAWEQQYNTNSSSFPQIQCIASYNGRLYAGTGYNYYEGIKVLVYDGLSWTDTGFNDSNKNEKPDKLIDYKEYLYMGTYNESSGCEIWRYDESNWELVASAGFGDSNNIVVTNMLIFNEKLIVSTANMVTGGELWQYDGNTWEQINADGFGDPQNLGLIASAHENDIYAGTYNEEYGGQLWKLTGSTWTKLVDNGLNDTNNFLISHYSFKGNSYIITGASETGVEVWRQDASSSFAWNIFLPAILSTTDRTH